MAREIERRWLFDVQKLYAVYTARVKLIVQKYTVIDDAHAFERRIRRQELDGLITYQWTDKIGHGEDREEISSPATAEEFDALGPSGIVGIPVIKDVYLHEIVNGLTMEVHAFKGPLAGHVSIEIEFPSRGAARNYIVPAWFGREVTDDRRYNGCDLCRYGVPKEEA